MGIAPMNAAREPMTKAETEFTIYTFQRDPAAVQERWQKHDVMADLSQALGRARVLFESGNYSRVEIKQKRTDSKTGAVHDSTTRVFRRREHKRLRDTVLVGLTALGGGLAFLLTHVLGGQP